MAGDWIKMRCNLWDDPRVARLCDLTDSGEAAIVGGLYWLWASADQHSEDGMMPGLTARSIDRKTGIPGLGDALAAVGWVEFEDDGALIVRFEEHNGKSAKRRCSESVRKMSARHADKPQTCSGQDADAAQQSCAPREREREEKSQQPISEQAVEVETSPPATPSAAAKRGNRLPADWQLPKLWGEWALQEKPAWSADDARRCSEKFRDHWLAKSGQGAAKVDWQATWRNWVRNEGDPPPSRASPSRINAQAATLSALTGGLTDPKPRNLTHAPTAYLPAA